MKNIFISAILLAFSASYAQTTIYTGNGTLNSTRTVTLGGFNLTFQGTSGQLFMNGGTGNIGLGTTTPTQKLDVIGNIKANVGYFTKSPANGQTFATNAARTFESTVLSAGTLTDVTTQERVFQFFDFPQSNMNSTPTSWLSVNNRNNVTRLRFWASQDGNSEFTLYDKTQTANFRVIDNNGTDMSVVLPKADSKLGIGTSSFTDGTDTYKLSVNGNIRANRVKVYTTWADFVFEDTYELPTLEEVEKHINDNGHLKDVPSAAQVETNGIELGEMNKILLQKIEELTLYTIEQNKINQQQAKQIEELSIMVQALSERK
ncbi:hypothetical protein AAEO56_07645 [Flavobacterium sp. DGU11]|uniref:Uncharacterized protein n=1 Tax=Flavobacterium arundinis TaxID=3139143 RepID=A0ABU9HVE2_9FLAO